MQKLGLPNEVPRHFQANYVACTFVMIRLPIELPRYDILTKIANVTDAPSYMQHCLKTLTASVV
jgi:hypothetical protein